MILRTMEEERKERAASSTFLSSTVDTGKVSLVNSEAVYGLTVDPSVLALNQSSFPWQVATPPTTTVQEFSQRPVSDLRQMGVGRALLFFPMGLTMRSLDDEFGEDLGLTLDDVPGLLEFTLRAFTFKQEYRDVAQAVLQRAVEEDQKRRGAKARKGKVTFVGIHNRRGDHLHYQKEVGAERTP